MRDVMHGDIALADASDMLESAFQRLQECECHTLPGAPQPTAGGLTDRRELGSLLMIRTHLMDGRQRNPVEEPNCRKAQAVVCFSIHEVASRPGEQGN